MPLGGRSLRFVFSAAGFIATRTFGWSPGVRMSWSAKWIWKPDTPGSEPAGARISAGKSGRVERSLPTTAVSLVNRPPVSCMPSPESPAKRIVTCSSCSTAFAISIKVAHPRCYLRLAYEPHHRPRAGTLRPAVALEPHRGRGGGAVGAGDGPRRPLVVAAAGGQGRRRGAHGARGRGAQSLPPARRGSRSRRDLAGALRRGRRRRRRRAHRGPRRAYAARGAGATSVTCGRAGSYKGASAGRRACPRARTAHGGRGAPLRG